MRMTAHQQKKRSAIFKQKHESFFGNQILLLFKLDGCFALEKQGTFFYYYFIKGIVTLATFLFIIAITLYFNLCNLLTL